jgi:hypothetical protein
MQMDTADVGLEYVHQSRDIGAEGVLPHEEPADIRQGRGNDRHRRIPNDHGDNTFRQLHGVLQFDTAHLRGHRIRRDNKNYRVGAAAVWTPASTGWTRGLTIDKQALG